MVGTSLTAGPPPVTARSGSPGSRGSGPPPPSRIFRLATQHREPSATLWVVVRPAEVPPGFAAWYEAHHPRLVTVLRAVTTDADADAAADAADEAMGRCLLHWERVRHMASPAGWTYRVALNELRRVGRRRALEQRLLRRLPPPRTVTEPDHEDLAGLLAGLSVRQRTAVAGGAGRPPAGSWRAGWSPAWSWSTRSAAAAAARSRSAHRRCRAATTPGEPPPGRRRAASGEPPPGPASWPT